jgi:hypothetical protein
MGCCLSSREYITDNEAENFVRDIIQKLKLRQLQFSHLNKSFASFDTIEKTETQEKHVFDEVNYEKVISEYWIHDDEKNEYLVFHKLLCPTYDELFDEGVDYTYYAYGLALVNDVQFKYRKILNILESKISNTEPTYGCFANFLEFYFLTHLVGFTSKINNIVQKTKAKITFNTKVVDAELKKNLSDLTKEIFNKNNILKLKTEVLGQLETLVLADADVKVLRSPLNEYKLNQSILDKLNEKYPFLFDTMELRHYFYLHFGGAKNGTVA